MKKSTKKILQVVFMIFLIYVLFKKDRSIERFTNDEKQSEIIPEMFHIVTKNVYHACRK